MTLIHVADPSVKTIPLVQQLDALLPQTQCSKCGHPSCRPYAEAMAKGEAINRCVPGGQHVIKQLANLLGVEPLPLDPAYGTENPIKTLAFIREAECIGCTKCIQACPVDAILGASQHTHTVIVDECTGCDLCVAPCPVDCIEMLPLAVTPEPSQVAAKAARARQRFDQRQQRLQREQAEKDARRQARTEATAKANAEAKTTAQTATFNNKALIIAAALARTNLKKAQKRLQIAQNAGQDTSALEAEIVRLQAEVDSFETPPQNHAPINSP